MLLTSPAADVCRISRHVREPSHGVPGQPPLAGGSFFAAKYACTTSTGLLAPQTTKRTSFPASRKKKHYEGSLSAVSMRNSAVNESLKSAERAMLEVPLYPPLLGSVRSNRMTTPVCENA